MREAGPIIVRPWLEKSPACRSIEIALRFCLTANFSETNHQGEFQAPGPDKAFHSPAPADAAIPDWPANPGLYSSHATGAWWPKLPATSPSSCAISALVGRSNSFGFQSRPATVTRLVQKTVFTQTQMARNCHTFALADRMPFS